jgi:hypothetical protein
VIGGGVLGTTLTAGTTQASERKLPSTLAITKDESDIDDGTANYQVAVGTEIESISAEAGEVVDGNHAEGRIGPTRGTDAFRFAGSIVDFSLDGDAAVFLNDERVDPAVLANTIDILSNAGDRAFYEIAVSGKLIAGTDADLSGGTHPDSIDEDRASGSVAEGGSDTYHYSGDLLKLSVEQPTVTHVNGDSVRDLPNTLTIESTAEDRASYEVAVAGRIGAGFDADLTGATHPDSISGGDDDFIAERGTEASGSVAGGGTDTYLFSKAITDLSVDGPADVYLNGEPVEELPNTFTVKSTDEERAFYEVSVDGRIEAGSDADLSGATHPDSIDGNTASGSVASGGVDSYRFTGDLTDLTVDGPAETAVNGEWVAPTSDESDDETGSCGFEQLDFSVENVSTEPSAVPPYSTVKGTVTNTNDESVTAYFDLRYYEVDESAPNRLDEPRVLTVAGGATDTWELSTEALIDEDRSIEVIPSDGIFG